MIKRTILIVALVAVVALPFLLRSRQADPERAAFQKLHSATPGSLRKPNAAEELTPQQIAPGATP